MCSTSSFVFRQAKVKEGAAKEIPLLLHEPGTLRKEVRLNEALRLSEKAALFLAGIGLQKHRVADA